MTDPSGDKDRPADPGQVLGVDCASGDVDLKGDGFSASAKLNELCEFSFGSVPAGA